MLKSICKTLLATLFLCLISLPLYAGEYIEHFYSNIIVNQDGSLDVTEIITVHHEGIEIRRGIYRDLPSTKAERYKIIDVTRNGIEEPWFIEKTDSGLRLNTGNDALLPAPATSVFTLRYIIYDVLRQIKEENANELYFNLTGKWNIPIEKVTSEIHYPPKTEILQQYGYQTGQAPKQLSQDQPFEFSDLLPRDEVTIAQAFKAGTVQVQLPFIWKWLIIAIIITLIYYLIVWFFFGKDPKARAIVPDWTPPQDLTPLECAYINNSGVEPKNSFFIHIIWLLHKHAVQVMETDAPASIFGKKKFYTLTTQDEADKTDREVNDYCNKYPNILTLTGMPNKNLVEYITTLKNKIITKMKKKYYRKRSFLTFLGALIVPAMIMLNFPEYTRTDTFNLLLLICFIIPFHPIKKMTFYMTLLLAMLPFCITLMIENKDFLIFLGCYILIITIFTYLMFQPTILGQRSIEKIEGLKMFLKTVNDSNIEQKNVKSNGLSMDKRLTPTDMEALFPYAVALGLEKAWSKKFQNIFGDETYRSMCQSRLYDENFRKTFNNMCAQTAVMPSTQSLGTASHGKGFAGGGFGGGGGGGR